MSMFIKYLNNTFTVLVPHENKKDARKGELHAHVLLLLIKTTKLTFPRPPWIIK